MKIRALLAGTLLAATAGATVGISQAVAGGGSAGCHTIVTHLANRPDSGEFGGDWALDTMARTTKICEVTPGQYAATVADSGTFTATKNSKTGAAISPAQSGNVEGGFAETFTAAPGFADYQGNFKGKHYTGTAPATSSEWLAKVYGGAISDDSGLLGWSWTYTRPCVAETWVNSVSGNSGQIAGRPCLTAPEPVWTARTCNTVTGGTKTPASYTLTAVAGVRWEVVVDGKQPVKRHAGTYPVVLPGRDVDVYVQAWHGDWQIQQWKHTFVYAKCASVNPPPNSSTPVTPPSSSSSKPASHTPVHSQPKSTAAQHVAVASSSTPAPAPSTSSSPAAELASTGTSYPAGKAALIGLAALLAGLGLLTGGWFMTRSRRGH